MEIKEFKKVFETFAKHHGFKKKLGVWVKETNTSLFFLDLQRSSFGHLYYLNINLIIKGLFGRNHDQDLNEMKTKQYDVSIPLPEEYARIFDFTIAMEEKERIIQLESIFNLYIAPFANKMDNLSEIIRLGENNELIVTHAVKHELEEKVKSNSIA